MTPHHLTHNDGIDAVRSEHAPEAPFVRIATNKTLFHLQALRGLAASLVVLSHSMDATKSRYAAVVDISGYFGVATFFIISGFIIYKSSRRSFGNVRDAAQFVVRRLIRIFPIYWIATALFVVLSPHRADYSASDIILSFALVPHYIAQTDGMNPLLGQGWSLHYELLFYMIFAVGLFLRRRNGLLLTIAALVALVAYGTMIRPLSDATGPLTLLQYWSRPIILLFAVGIGLGLLEERMTRRFTVPYPFFVMLALLAVWFAYSLTSTMTEADHLMFPDVLVIWVFCAACVFVSIFGQSKEGLFEAMAERFGDASYSVYLFHTFILSVLVRLKLQDVSPTLFVIAALVGANVFGLLMYAWVEKPILRTLRTGLMKVSVTRVGAPV